MLMNTSGWRAYHEAVCSPGLPWDCAKHCILWKMFQFQRQRVVQGEEATYSGLTRATYAGLKSSVR